MASHAGTFSSGPDFNTGMQFTSEQVDCGRTTRRGYHKKSASDTFAFAAGSFLQMPPQPDLFSASGGQNNFLAASSLLMLDDVPGDIFQDLLDDDDFILENTFHQAQAPPPSSASTQQAATAPISIAHAQGTHHMMGAAHGHASLAGHVGMHNMGMPFSMPNILQPMLPPLAISTAATTAHSRHGSGSSAPLSPVSMPQAPVASMQHMPSSSSLQSSSQMSRQTPVPSTQLQTSIESSAPTTIAQSSYLQKVKAKPEPNFATQTRGNAFDPAQLDPKRAKRIVANRQSARRSRMKKLQYIYDLELEISQLTQTVQGQRDEAVRLGDTHRELYRSCESQHGQVSQLHSQLAYQLSLAQRLRAEIQQLQGGAAAAAAGLQQSPRPAVGPMAVPAAKVLVSHELSSPLTSPLAQSPLAQSPLAQSPLAQSPRARSQLAASTVQQLLHPQLQQQGVGAQSTRGSSSGTPQQQQPQQHLGLVEFQVGGQQQLGSPMQIGGATSLAGASQRQQQAQHHMQQHPSLPMSRPLSSGQLHHHHQQQLQHQQHAGLPMSRPLSSEQLPLQHQPCLPMSRPLSSEQLHLLYHHQQQQQQQLSQLAPCNSDPAPGLPTTHHAALGLQQQGHQQASLQQLHHQQGAVAGAGAGAPGAQAQGLQGEEESEGRDVLGDMPPMGIDSDMLRADSGQLSLNGGGLAAMSISLGRGSISLAASLLGGAPSLGAPLDPAVFMRDSLSLPLRPHDPLMMGLKVASPSNPAGDATGGMSAIGGMGPGPVAGGMDGVAGMGAGGAGPNGLPQGSPPSELKPAASGAMMDFFARESLPLRLTGEGPGAGSGAGGLGGAEVSFMGDRLSSLEFMKDSFGDVI